MEHLDLPIQPTSKFRVYIGNGDFLVCQHSYPHIELLMQGILFTLDLYVLLIEGSNVVLDIQWLQQLGYVAHDYSELTMEFCWDGEQVILKGDVAATSSLITLHQFQILLHSSKVHPMFTL